MEKRRKAPFKQDGNPKPDQALQSYDPRVGLKDFNVSLNVKLRGVNIKKYEGEMLGNKKTKQNKTAKSGGKKSSCDPRLSTPPSNNLIELLDQNDLVSVLEFEDDIIDWLEQSDKNVFLFLENPIQAIADIKLDISRRDLKKLGQIRHALARTKSSIPGLHLTDASISVEKSKENGGRLLAKMLERRRPQTPADRKRLKDILRKLKNARKKTNPIKKKK